jgi:hypothetical protein
MFFSKRDFNALRSSSRCSGDNSFLLLILLLFVMRCYFNLLTIVSGEIELRQRRRRGMDLLRRDFSSEDSLQALLPSCPV